MQHKSQQVFYLWKEDYNVLEHFVKHKMTDDIVYDATKSIEKQQNWWMM